jgi:hypothetical protein
VVITVAQVTPECQAALEPPAHKGLSVLQEAPPAWKDPPVRRESRAPQD